MSTERVLIGSAKTLLTNDGTMYGVSFDPSALVSLTIPSCVKHRKEIPFPNEDSETKILLSKIAGQYRATSLKCTHYGAPLAKGVITCDGKVVCPWHGAKFCTSTGDIEDAPGLNSLQVFKVEVEGDNVYIHPPSQGGINVMANSREPKPASKPDNNKGVVIIGGGAGAAHAIEALREKGYKNKITILSNEPHLPIDRTKLSKALITESEKIQIRTKEFYDKLGQIEFKLDTQVEKIDFENNAVEVGKDKFEYEHLIVSTGAKPNRIPVDGSNLENIFVMRTVQDAKQIDEAIGAEPENETDKKNVVVIGSSFIGMEVAFAAAARANVSVVGMESAPFEAILGSAVGNGIKKAHEEKGTKFYLPASLSSFAPSKDSPNKVGSVLLKDGTEVKADVVILGVGVKPATEILKNSGLNLEKDQSIKTDEFLKIQAVNKGNVFAIGDIANYKDVKSGEHVRVEHWNVAGNHARAVAATIMGKPEPFEKISVFWSAQKAQLRYAGTSRAKSWKDVHIEGNPDELKFVAYYTVGEDVVAVASMGNDPIAAHVSELMRLNKMLSISDIKNGKSPFDVELK
ncbi:Apoptosis-inducing factor 1 [Microbotryomycetes sp. JL221]|nr:Apoptosis-inducing factor 1 [Microbotryomycetes sp. JL221]